ncbi:MAG: nitroreductase family protein, partial [Alistipes sp.]|nr:nitroreductase family protein [Alistipes sp.]
MKKLFKSILVIATAISAVGCCCSEKQCGEACSKEEAVKEVIMTRRSIRDYKEEPVCREQMAKILEAGIYAPSAMNMQTWAVRVVDNKEFIDGVTAIAVAQNPKM